jgi:hypothetical protein
MPIVNEGTPPTHTCSEGFAEDRPYEHHVNVGTVWLCPHCGEYWQVYNQPVSDYEGGYYGTERRWRRVLNAQGEMWINEPVDESEYLTYRNLLWAKCSKHGLVSVAHTHFKRVKKVVSYE